MVCGGLVVMCNSVDIVCSGVGVLCDRVGIMWWGWDGILGWYMMVLR